MSWSPVWATEGGVVVGRWEEGQFCGWVWGRGENLGSCSHCSGGGVPFHAVLGPAPLPSHLCDLPRDTLVFLSF